MQGEVSETMHKEQPSGEAWKRLVEWAKESLEVHRSACSIAERKGESTNWEAFTKKVKERIYEGVLSLKAYEAAQSAEPQRPKIVCLCGSTRFAKEFADANERETLAGNIVLSVGCFRRTAPDGQREPMEESVKAALDVLHKRKIDLADEVLVLNVGGYIGDSTRSEIEHARKTGKRVRYLEPGRTPTNDQPLPASTDEPPESQIAIQQGMIERLTKERDEAKVEHLAEIARNNEFHRNVNMEIDGIRAKLKDAEEAIRIYGLAVAERDSLKAELANERARIGQVTTAQINVIAELQEQIRKLKVESATQTDAISEREDRIDRMSHDLGKMTKERDELQAKLAAPEMPEVVRALLGIFDTFGAVSKTSDYVKAVRDYYAPPFKVHGPGVYFDSKGDTWRLVIKDRGGMWLGYRERDCLSEWFPETDHPMQSHKLTTYLRPLEG